MSTFYLVRPNPKNAKEWTNFNFCFGNIQGTKFFITSDIKNLGTYMIYQNMH